MTTRLYAGSIQRVVTVDTHCWMWVLHLFTLLNLHVSTTCDTIQQLPVCTMCYYPLFSSALRCFPLSCEVDPHRACHVRLLCVMNLFVIAYVHCRLRLTVCLWVHINCLFTSASTCMLTWSSVIMSSNGYLMLPVVLVLLRCHVVVAESSCVVCCCRIASRGD